MTQENELRHLVHGAYEAELPGGIGTVRFDVVCPANAELVLDRVKTVLKSVIMPLTGEWPSFDDWRQMLPEWFIVSCAPEVSQIEAQERIARWQKLSWEDKAKIDREKKWSLSNWLSWMVPDQRPWFWWDEEINDPGRIRLAIEVPDWPFPWRALRWLFIAAGATDVKAEE